MKIAPLSLDMHDSLLFVSVYCIFQNGLNRLTKNVQKLFSPAFCRTTCWALRWLQCEIAVPDYYDPKDPSRWTHMHTCIHYAHTHTNTWHLILGHYLATVAACIDYTRTLHTIRTYKLSIICHGCMSTGQCRKWPPQELKLVRQWSKERDEGKMFGSVCRRKKCLRGGIAVLHMISIGWFHYNVKKKSEGARNTNYLNLKILL